MGFTHSYIFGELVKTKKLKVPRGSARMLRRSVLGPHGDHERRQAMADAIRADKRTAKPKEINDGN